MEKRNNKKSFLRLSEYIMLSIMTLIVIYTYFGLYDVDLNYPLNYSVDGFTGLVGIKELLLNGDDMLGWPYHISMFKYNACYDLLYRIFIEFCGLFTNNYVHIYNAYIITILYVNVMVTYYVMKLMNIKWYLSYLSALLFGTSVYIQMRICAHMALAAVECVPILVLLIFWLYEDDTYCKLSRDWYKNPKNYIGILMAWMIANNGMVYYPFFSCFFIVVAGAYKFVENKSLKSIYPFFVQISEIIIMLGIDFIPTVIGMIGTTDNIATHGVQRNAYRATLYGLDLKAMFLSPNGYRIPGVIEKYGYLIVGDNENKYAYLGVIASLGCVGLLLFTLFSKSDSYNEYGKRIVLLSRLNITAILLAVLNGFCVIIAIWIPFISCYNRILPYIYMFSVLAVDYMVQNWVNNIKLFKRRIFIMIFVSFLFVYSIWEQYGVVTWSGGNVTGSMGTYLVDSVAFEKDKEFFQRLEDEAGKNAMVFQLPYMKNFENGATYNIADYDHLKCYYFTDTIKWSYGAALGTENDEWYKNTSELGAQELCRELKEKGFAGIYLNLNGFVEDERTTVLKELSDAANCVEEDLVYDTDGLRVYIALDNYS